MSWKVTLNDQQVRYFHIQINAELSMTAHKILLDKSV